MQGGEVELDVPEPVHHAEAGNSPYHEVRSYFGLHFKGWFREIFKLFLRFCKVISKNYFFRQEKDLEGSRAKVNFLDM